MDDFIKNIWNSKADKFRDSHWASWGDHFAIELEIENIGRFIKDGHKVLDAGCANGYTAFRHFSNHKIELTGIDYAENMIQQANKAIFEKGLDGNIKFKVGDIRKMEFIEQTFDITYTTRVLINLPNWDEQIKGIQECMRVTKKNGLVIFSEAFWEPLVLLNSLRTIKDLPPLMEHDYNRYLKRSKLETYLKTNNYNFEVIDFSSVYYLGTRFLRELLTEYNKYPGYSNPINELFYNIEKEYSGGGFGIQIAYVIYK